MKFVEEKITDQHLKVHLTIEKEDYREKVEKALRETRKKMTLKGFRTGKVPVGIVKKMYGKAILSEELGKIVDDKINEHILENKYQLIGRPIPSETDKAPDLDTQEEFQFSYELGLAPEIELSFDEEAYDYYTITSDDEKLDEYIENLRTQHGETLEGESVQEGDVIIGEMAELDEDGKPSDDNLKATIVFDKIKDEAAKKSFEGKKPGDTLTFNPLKATGSKKETAILLGKVEEEIGDTTPDYQFTITKINRVKPAELNEEFYKKVFPGEEEAIPDFDTFREKLWKDVSKYYVTESDTFFARQVLDKVIGKAKENLSLPKEFTKKYYLLNNENLTEEQLEKDWDNIQDSVLNQLVFNKIAEEFQIDVTRDDIRNHIYKILLNMYGMEDSAEMKALLDNTVDNVLKDEKEYERAYNEIFDIKVREAIVKRMKKNTKEVSYKEYKEIVDKYVEQQKK